jgi:hypothetical protein
VKERFLLDRIQVNGTGVSAHKAEKLSIAVLPYPAKASLAQGNATLPGAKFTANRSFSERLIKRGKPGLEQPLLRGLGKSPFRRAGCRGKTKGAKPCTAEFEEVPPPSFLVPFHRL